MSIRYIGAFLIFAACGAFGFSAAANHRREVNCLAELVRLLEGMRSELEFRLTPLPQICQNAAQEATGWLQTVFSVLAQELECQVAPDAAACMQIALDSAKDIPIRIRKVLTELGNSLGKFDLAGQLNEINAVKQQCQAQLEQINDQLDLRLRSYRTLGLCVGAGLAILFL